MKKIIYTTLFSIVAGTMAMAQAVLPTSYSWVGAYPAGWSAVDPLVSYYTAGSSAHTNPSLKMDATGDKVIINFATTPGTLSYWIISTGTFGAGIFKVEESVDGNTWTPLRTFQSPTLPPTSWTQYSDTPNAASRYVRFNYATKISGSNIGLDDVSLSAGVSPNQEISVKQGTTTIVNGGTYSFSSPVSTLSPVTFTVYNLGLATLNVSGAVISGTAATDYSIATATPFTVNGTSNTNFVINFTPSVAGTRSAVLSITNDDLNANPYVINLDGIGGNFATEPTSPPTNLIFSNVKSYHLTGSYTAAAGTPDGYIVIRSGAVITDAPVDGTVYQKGDNIGSSQVVVCGNMTGFFPNNIVANTTYYFAVFAYNGTGIYRNYLTSSPLTGSIASAGSLQPPSYYTTVSTSNSTFVSDLHTKINSHSVKYYSDFGPLMIARFLARDTVNNQRVVTCSYSGLNQVYTEPWDWASNDFAREHTYPQSWMPTVNDANFTSRAEYSDYHMLVQANQNNVNAIRSNYPLGEVVGTPTYTYLGCKTGNDINGKKVFEPRDADKGDAARCMLYQSICYTTTGTNTNTDVTYGGVSNSWSLPTKINNTNIPYGQDQNVLKKWSYLDPVDNFEISRNDFVDSLQGNRNPFIDHPEYVCYIDFSTMTMITNPTVPCDANGISENQNNDDLISIYPNPNNGNFMLNYTSKINQNVSLKLYDRIGRIVYSSELKVSNGINPIEMNIQNLNSGIYLFEFITEEGKQTQKFIIE